MLYFINFLAIIIQNIIKKGSKMIANMKYSNILARRDFLKYSMSTLSALYFTGCSNGETQEVVGYPIDSTVMTTLQRTIKPSQSFSPIISAENLQNISDYDASGYGVWHYDTNPPSAEVRNDLISPTYTLPADGKKQRLLKFFAVTDIHITDKESPSQLIYMQPANILGNQQNPKLDIEDKVSSVYSPTMLYTTQVFDAFIQTVNALHKQDSIDFGLSLGDTCNSTQYNELRWYIDILDGKVITPSSGLNVGASTIDYQKPFKAAGLDSEIPWYQAVGNHDHFWLGSIPLDVGNSTLRASYVSEEVIALPDTLARGANVLDMSDPLYYMGVIDGSTPTGKIIKAGPIGDFATPPTVIPDVKRRSLTKAQWAEEFFNTTSKPVGHGLNLVPSDQKPEFGCYSFVPKSELPIKIIVLDDTQREDDGDVSIHGRGFLDQARWSWLKDELAAGTDAEQLMIIACHVPIAVAPHKKDNNNSDTYMDWYENTRFADMENAVTLPELINELHKHENLLMWMAGHRHVNIVKAFKGATPEQGFWQVETSSFHDYPQQGRLFEINLNSDYTISIDVTNVDPAAKEGTPAWTARKYAVAAQQILQTDLSPNFTGADPENPGIKDPTIKPTGVDSASYNAQLVKQLSPTMKARLQTLFPVI